MIFATTRPSRVAALLRVAKVTAARPEEHIANRLTAAGEILRDDADAYTTVARLCIAARYAWVRERRQRLEAEREAARLSELELQEMLKAAETEDVIEDRKEWREDHERNGRVQ